MRGLDVNWPLKSGFSSKTKDQNRICMKLRGSSVKSHDFPRNSGIVFELVIGGLSVWCWSTKGWWWRGSNVTGAGRRAGFGSLALAARSREERARHGSLGGALGEDGEAANPAGDRVEDHRRMNFSVLALLSTVHYLKRLRRERRP
jgi:hypothetical protein